MLWKDECDLTVGVSKELLFVYCVNHIFISDETFCICGLFGVIIAKNISVSCPSNLAVILDESCYSLMCSG